MKRPLPADFTQNIEGMSNAALCVRFRCGHSTLARFFRESGVPNSARDRATRSLSSPTSADVRAAMLARARVERDPCARCGVPGDRHGGESHSYVASVGVRF